ncbi:hypothetical protein [Verrucosispora sioxanthis]|uniref:hypothetical protein n=1 Tax=Verrucosispora sioxanthis TaxID=2499994 RepID=UPI001C102C3D|nr:hypothetical protein [Verrucosispora sioxanthis]
MGAPQDGRPDPAALRQLAADWRAQGDRLELLGDNMMAAYNDITWFGLAHHSADTATNLVDLKLRKVQQAAHEFAKFLDDYADKVQEAIDKEKARTIIEIVLALFGLLTIGLAAVLGPMLAALGRLLAGLLSAMSQLAGKIVTAVIDVAIGIIVWGTLQVAMEFGTTAVVSAIVGVPADYTASIAISVVIAAVMGGLFSIRGVNNVPVKGVGTGGRPGDIPNPASTPVGGSSTDVTTNGALVDKPQPYQGGTVENVPTVGVDGTAFSATDVPPVLPGAGRAAPTSAVGDQRVYSGAGSVGNAGRAAEHAAPQTVPRTSENIVTPAMPTLQSAVATPGGHIGGKGISGPPGPREVGTLNVDTTPPGGTVANRAPTVPTGDTPPVANLDRGVGVGQPPRVSAGGDVSPVSSVGGRGSTDIGDISPLTPTPSHRGSFDIAATVAGRGDLVAQPPPQTALSGADTAASMANTHGTGRVVTPDSASTGTVGARGTVSDLHATSTGGHVTNPAVRPGPGGTAAAPPYLGEHLPTNVIRPGGGAPVTTAPPGLGEHVPTNGVRPGGATTGSPPNLAEHAPSNVARQGTPSPHLGDNVPASTARPGAVNSVPPSVEHAPVNASSAHGTPRAEVPAAGQGRGMHHTVTSGPVPVPHGVNLPPAMRPGGLADLPTGVHVTWPPSRAVGVEHLAPTAPGRVVAPEVPVTPVRAVAPEVPTIGATTAPTRTVGGIVPSRDAVSSTPVSAAGTNAGHPSAPPRETGVSGSGAVQPGAAPVRDIPNGAGTPHPVPVVETPRPVGRPIEPPSRTDTPEARTGTTRHPAVETTPVPAKVPTDASQSPVLGVRDGRNPDMTSSGKTADAALQERLDRLTDGAAVRWSDDLVDGVETPRSLVDRITGSRVPEFPEVPARDPGAGQGSGGRDVSSAGNLVEGRSLGELPEPPKGKPGAPKPEEVAEFPAVPTGLERPRAMIEDFGAAAGLPRRELDELLDGLGPDAVLGKGTEAAVTRELIEGIGARAGMDASVARGFAERVTSPNTATAQVARTEFQAELQAFADDNRMIERLVNLRIGHAEDAGVPMTGSIRKELTQALRSGDATSLDKITRDLDQAIDTREAAKNTAGEKSLAAMEDQVARLKQWKADRDAVAASDAAAEKAARDKFVHDFRDGPLAEFKKRVGAEDAAGAARAMGLRTPVEPTRVEPPAGQRHDDIVASEKEWAHHQSETADAVKRLEALPQLRPKELDELLGSADHLGGRAGLSPKEIVEIRAEVEARWGGTLSLDEAKRTLLENIAVRAGMDPERAATLASRDINGGISGRHARQVYGDELDSRGRTNRLIDRQVRLTDDFERHGLPFDDTARERLTLAYRQGDVAVIDEITGPLNEARALANSRAARAGLEADQELARRLAELRKPIDPPGSTVTAAEPTPAPAGARTPEELAARDRIQEAFRRDVLPELHTKAPLKPTPGQRVEPSVSERMGRTDDVADQSRAEEVARRLDELDVPKGQPPHDELPAMPNVPASTASFDALRTFGKGLAGDAGLDDAATAQLLRGIDDRWGSEILSDTRGVAARRTLVEEMYARFEVPPNKVRTEDLAGSDAELQQLARAGFRAELSEARQMKDIGGRLADLTMPSGYDLADDVVNGARNRLAEAYRKGDFDSVDQTRLEIGEQISIITARQHADELAVREAEQTAANRSTFGRVMDDLATRMRTDDAKLLPGTQNRPEGILPAGPGEALLMAKPQPRDPISTPSTVTRADPLPDPPPRTAAQSTPLEQAEKDIADRTVGAVTAERDLHAAGLDADSRFRAGIAEFRMSSPGTRLDLEAVRAEYDARIAASWRDRPDSASWPAYVAAAAAALPQIIEQAVARDVPAATTDVNDPVTSVTDEEFRTELSRMRDPESIPPVLHDLLRHRWIDDSVRFAQEFEAAELADDLFTRAVGVVDYDHGLDLPAAVQDRMRRTFVADVLHNHDVIRYQGDEARFAEDGGRDAVWRAYTDRLFRSVEVDLRMAQTAWTAAQSAATQFHGLVDAGRADALDQNLSDLSVRVLGELFAAEQLALRTKRFYGLEDLQRQAFQDQLDALRRPVDEIAALTDAERAKGWQQQTNVLLADHARRLETATLAERHRPDLVRDFDTAVAEATAHTGHTGIQTLDGLPAAARDALRADFVTTGRRWFGEVFAPAITAAVRAYDSLFVDAEAQWRHQYEHLRTSIRRDAFVHLQAHRHDEAVAAAVAAHRHVSEEHGWDEPPESAYALAQQEFFAAAAEKLRASVKEKLDPFAKIQAAHWEDLAAEIERSITHYFNDDRLREYAARAQATAASAGTAGAEPLAEPPTAYEQAARPILDAVRAEISVGLHRDGREVTVDVRNRIAREVEPGSRGAGRQHGDRDRGGHRGTGRPGGRARRISACPPVAPGAAHHRTAPRRTRLRGPADCP